MATKTVAITMGDPAGIGPEVIIKALREDEFNGAPSAVVGCLKALQRLQAQGPADGVIFRATEQVADARFTLDTIHVIDEPLAKLDELILGTAQAQTGDLTYRCVKWATELTMKGDVHVIAAAPLNKEALYLGGHSYPGRTELLVAPIGSRNYVTVLCTDKSKVIHVSTHIALRKFLDTFNGQRIETMIGIADTFLEHVDFAHPRIAVAGMNPYARENGLFDDEEIHIVGLVIENMKAKGMDVYGLYPPDIVSLQTHEDQYDTVVTMYHDQGHILLRLLGFHDGINITAGSSFIRTSASHGTVFDIVWTGKARSENMAVSIKLAI